LNTISPGVETDYTVELRLDDEKGTVIGKGNLTSDLIKKDSSAVIPVQWASDGKMHNLVLIFKAGNPFSTRPILRSIEFLSR
jgi:hypothetical protein